MPPRDFAQKSLRGQLKRLGPRRAIRQCGRYPFNQNFRIFRSKTQWIGSVQPEKFRKTGPPFDVVLFSRSDRSEFLLDGSRPVSIEFRSTKFAYLSSR